MTELNSDAARLCLLVLLLVGLAGCRIGQESDLPQNLAPCCYSAIRMSEDGHVLVRTAAVLQGSCPNLTDCLDKLGMTSVQLLSNLSEVMTIDKREESIRVRASQPCWSSPNDPSSFCPQNVATKSRGDITLIDSD